jgi:hypothetical protein
MKIPPGDGPYDAVYSIEASCHAPDKAALYQVLARVMKPGALFASYECCVTPRYDPANAEHQAIKRGIEEGDALPELPGFDVVHEAVDAAGLEMIESRDLAAEADPETPWFEPLAALVSVRGFPIRAPAAPSRTPRCAGWSWRASLPAAPAPSAPSSTPPRGRSYAAEKPAFSPRCSTCSPANPYDDVG